MKFKIDDKIFEKYPALNIGIVLAKEIDNFGESQDIIAMAREQSEEIKEKYGLETLKDEPMIKSWREAFSLFGAKPKKYTASVENLYRMILEGVELRHINKIVDIYNYISLKHTVPVGGDDIDKVNGDIVLRFAIGDEPFRRLNSEEVDHPKAGEVVYSDNKEILCRRWNWRECDKSKMTEETKNVAIVVEGLPPVTIDDVENITLELGELIQKFCGGEIGTFVINSEKRGILLG